MKIFVFDACVRCRHEKLIAKSIFRSKYEFLHISKNCSHCSAPPPRYTTATCHCTLLLLIGCRTYRKIGIRYWYMIIRTEYVIHPSYPLLSDSKNLYTSYTIRWVFTRSQKYNFYRSVASRPCPIEPSV